MDTLFWSNTFTGIKIRPTKKLFYGKFLWRLVVEVPSGNLIYSKALTMSEALEYRRLHARSYNWAGSWSHGYLTQGKAITDATLLTIARNIKNHYGNTIRIRVEEPMMQFYAADQGTLKEIAREFTYPNDYRSQVKEINGPDSDQLAAILLDGGIIRRSADYNYKVILRDGRYTLTAKQQVLSYLDNLGDQIRITPRCREQLAQSNAYCWGVSFYTNDPDLTIVLRLIDPNIVGNIHQLIVLDK